MTGKMGRSVASNNGGSSSVFDKLYEVARTDFQEYARCMLSTTNDLLTKCMKKSSKRNHAHAKIDEGKQLIKNLNDALTQLNKRLSGVGSKDKIDNANIELAKIQNNEFRLLQQYNENKKTERWDHLPQVDYDDVIGAAKMGAFSLRALREGNVFNPNQFNESIFNKTVAILDGVKRKVEELRDIEKHLPKLSADIVESFQFFSLTKAQINGNVAQEENLGHDEVDPEKSIVMSASTATNFLIHGNLLGADVLQSVLAIEENEVPQKFQPLFQLPNHEGQNQEVRPVSLLGQIIVGEVKPSYLASMPVWAELASCDFKGFLDRICEELTTEVHELRRKAKPMRLAVSDINEGTTILADLRGVVETITQTIGNIRTGEALVLCSASISQVLTPAYTRARNFIKQKKQPNLDNLPKVDFEGFREKTDYYLRLILAFNATKRFNPAQFDPKVYKATIGFILDLYKGSIHIIQLNQKLLLLDPNYAICSQERRANEEAVQELVQDTHAHYGRLWAPKLHVSGIPQALFNSHNKIAGVYEHGVLTEGYKPVENEPVAACCTVM